MAEDLKIKTAAAKPPLQMLPLRAYIGPTRVTQYGRKKYAPGNYLRATLEDGCGERYAGAALRHLAAMQEDNGLWSRESLGRLDVESGLPELDHAICSLIMLRSILVKEGVLAEDPGEGKDPPAVAPVQEPLVRLTVSADGRPMATYRVDRDFTTTLEAEPAPSAILCECGHRKDDHTANSLGFCIHPAQNPTFPGELADDCMRFTPAAAIKVV